MIVWLWIGGAVMAIGTIMAIAPRLRRTPKRSVPVDSAGPDGVDDLPDADAQPSGSEASKDGSEAGVTA